MKVKSPSKQLLEKALAIFENERDNGVTYNEAWRRAEKENPQLIANAKAYSQGGTLQNRQTNRFLGIRHEFCNDNVSQDFLTSLYTVMPPQLISTLGLRYNATADEIGMMLRDKAPKLPAEQQKWVFNALVLAIARDSNLSTEAACEKAKQQFPNLYNAVTGVAV